MNQAAAVLGAFHPHGFGVRVTGMNNSGGDSDDGWRGWDPDDEDEPRDWEIEPEEEKADRHPTLSGTAPLARVLFLGLVGLFVLAGVLALIRGLGSWLHR